MESQDNSTGAINCSGSLSLDLPPGVVAAGGHRTLTSDVDYTVEAAADGSGNVVLLRNADPIVTPLATLARAANPPEAPATTARPPGSALQPNTPQQPQENVAASVSANKEVGPVTVFAGRPSFDCSRARSRGELTVCSDPGLSELDVNMATQYRRALATASTQQEGLLKQTGNRSSLIATAVPIRIALPRRILAECARSAISWRAIGNRRDKWWISRTTSLSPRRYGPHNSTVN